MASPGGTLTLSSRGFPCSEWYPAGVSYTVTLGQAGRAAPIALGTVAVQRDGSFRTRITIPTTASPGQSYLIVHGKVIDACGDTVVAPLAAPAPTCR
jgi:hypothetical protein